MKANYERPVEATLIVRLANGEEWEATPPDLTKFELVSEADAYMRLSRAMSQALAAADLLPSRDLTKSQLNPLRHLAEVAIMLPGLVSDPDHEKWDSVAELERRLRGWAAVHDLIGELEQALPVSSIDDTIARATERGLLMQFERALNSTTNPED